MTYRFFYCLHLSYFHQRLTFRFQNFMVSRLLPFFEGFGFGEIGHGKKVSDLVSENLVPEKNYQFGFRRIWSWSWKKKYQFRKKVSVSEKSFGFGKFGWKSLGISFGQNFGIVIQWLPCLDLVCIRTAYFLVEVHMIKDGRVLFVKVHPAQCTVSTERVYIF